MAYQRSPIAILMAVISVLLLLIAGILLFKSDNKAETGLQTEKNAAIYIFPNSEQYSSSKIIKAGVVPNSSLDPGALDGYGDPMSSGISLSQIDPEVNFVSASSTLSAKGRTYSSSFVNDNDYTTWWSPGPPNKDGRGSWISFRLNSTRTIRGFRIWGGAHYNPRKKTEDLYNNNNRVALLRVSTGESLFYLSDVNAMQECIFEQPVSTNILQFTFLEVYKGFYNDLCISHIELIYAN